MIRYDNRIKFARLWRKIKNKLPFVNVQRTKYLLGACNLNIEEFEKRLIGIAYQYNYFSYTEKGQISNMRKLYINIINGKEEIRQVHARLFDDGKVYIHDELSYEQDAIGHIKAKTLQRPNMINELELVKVLEIQKE